MENRASTRGGKTSEVTRYGFTDPRDGATGVHYPFSTEQEAQTGAGTAGRDRFEGYTSDGSVVQFYRDRAGQWHQAQNEAEIHRNQAPERHEAARAEHVDRILRAGDEWIARAQSPLTPELRDAFTQFGVDPQRDRDARLQGGIEARIESFRPYGADGLKAGEVKRWVDLDARALGAIQDTEVRSLAATAIAGNSAFNEGYRTTLETEHRDVATRVSRHIEVARPDTTYTGKIAGEANGKIIQEHEGTGGFVIHDKPAIANDTAKFAGKNAEIKYFGDVGLVHERSNHTGAALNRELTGREARIDERER